MKHLWLSCGVNCTVIFFAPIFLLNGHVKYARRKGPRTWGCHCDSSEQKGSFRRYIRLEFLNLAAAWNAFDGRAVRESVCSFANSNNHDIDDVAFYLTDTCKGGSDADGNCLDGHNAGSSWASDILRYNGCNLPQSGYKRDSTVDQRRYCRATSRPWGRQPQLQSILCWDARRDPTVRTEQLRAAGIDGASPCTARSIRNDRQFERS